MLAAVAPSGLHDHARASDLGDGLDQAIVAFLPAVAAVYVDDQQALAKDAIAGLEPAGLLDIVELLLVPMGRDLPVARARVFERRGAVRIAAVAPPFAMIVALGAV